MKIFTTRNLIKMSLVTAIYVAITAVFQSTSFGPFQFRISEILNLLAFFNPIHIASVSLGCFISNLLWSPFGIVDVIVGTLHTIVSLYFMWKIRNIVVSSFAPAVFSFIVALGIAFMMNTMEGFLITYFYIAVSEIIICVIIGLPVIMLLYKNGLITKYIEDKDFKKDHNVSSILNFRKTV